MSEVRVIRGVAVFDLAVTACLALPILSHVLINTLFRLDYWMTGVEVTPGAAALTALAWLFVNIGGILGVLWAIVRIAMPSRELAFADAIARCFVASLILYALLDPSIPRVLFGFVFSELLGSAIQFVVLRRAAG